MATTDPCDENILCHITGIKTNVLRLREEQLQVNSNMDVVLQELDSMNTKIDSIETTLETCCAEEPPIEVNESPFVYVNNETEFDSALNDGRSIILKGEGSGGVISLTGEKSIEYRFTEIMGPGIIEFNIPQPAGVNPRAFTVHADDVTFRNFELVSLEPVATNKSFAIGFCDDISHNHGHRMKLIDMHIHNWHRIISKVDAIPTAVTTTHEDCLIERLYGHTFSDRGLLLDHGLHRLLMRDSRIIGRLGGEAHTTNNALHGGIRWEDNTFINCVFANVDLMGFEATLGGYGNYHRNTRLFLCRSENCGSMGFSTMFGTGIIIDKCVAKNVKWIGFEIGGRAPENSEYGPGGPYRFGQGILDGCEIDGVSSPLSSVDPAGAALGISIDCAQDTVVRGATKITNIRSVAFPDNKACGICITNCERCSVKGATFKDAGRAAIYITRGDPGTNTRGFHEISDNTFRDINPLEPGGWPTGGEEQLSMEIFDTTVEIRNNTSWAKGVSSMRYRSCCVSPAKVTVDGVAVPFSVPDPGPPPDLDFQYFTGSNKILFGGDYTDPE